jgi:uncharacterized membrane protein
MQSNTDQQQSENQQFYGYGPQGPTTPSGLKEEEPQGSYRPDDYPPSQPNPPYYQGQQWQQQMYSPYYVPPRSEIPPYERTSMGMRARTAGLLCYLFGWVGGLVFLLLERENRFVRFHAMQSLLFFGIGGALGLVTFVVWIVLIVSACRGRYFKLPLFGDYAEQYANRPRR